MELDFKHVLKNAQEILTPEVGKIKGQIPEWLKGNYYRVGPGYFDFSDGFSMNHFYDGYALLSKFEILNETVEFQQRFLQSETYQRSVAVNRPIAMEFGTRAYPDKNKNFFSRTLSSIIPMDLSDNTICTVFNLGSDIFTCNDSCFVWKFNRNDLTSEEKFDTNKFCGLSGVIPHTLADSENVYFLGFSMMTGLKFSIVKTPHPKEGESAKEALKNSTIVASFVGRWATSINYLHSFAMTENYFILVDQPLLLGMKKLATSALSGKSLLEILDWQANEKNHFFIIEKSTGKKIPFEFASDDTFFYYHFVNCYEEEGHVVIDIHTYSDPSYLHSLELKKLRNNVLGNFQPSQIKRFVIPLLTEKEGILDDVNLVTLPKTVASAVKRGKIITLNPQLLDVNEIETTTINPNYYGKKHSYLYSNGNAFYTNASSALFKYNLNSSEVKIWKEGQCIPGEIIFIPNPKGTCEDDGICISAVTEGGKEKKGFLLFLDGKTFEEIGRAEFNSIPLALHGTFLMNK